jgi:hypothetical protein
VCVQAEKQQFLVSAACVITWRNNVSFKVEARLRDADACAIQTATTLALERIDRSGKLGILFLLLVGHVHGSFLWKQEIASKA